MKNLEDKISETKSKGYLKVYMQQRDEREGGGERKKKSLQITKLQQMSVTLKIKIIMYPPCIRRN